MMSEFGIANDQRVVSDLELELCYSCLLWNNLILEETCCKGDCSNQHGESLEAHLLHGERSMGRTTVCIKQKRNRTPNFIIETGKNKNQQPHKKQNTFSF